MARHAYLLIVHELPDQVQQLVDLLDDPRNDIYVMADATGEIDPTRLTTSRSRIIALPRIPLHWAGYSMLEAMLRMLEAATPAGPYAYYHHLSGTDLPLVSQDTVHERLAGEEREFVDYQPEYLELARWKVGYWHPFVETSAYRRHKAVRVVSHAVVKGQKVVGRSRTEVLAAPVRHGSAFFSITHALATHVVTQREWIERSFRGSICPDEVYLQTLLAGSGSRFDVADPSGGAPANLRHIDWNRRNGNSPYTFRLADLDELRRASSTSLFARKFSRSVDPRIVDHIHRALREGADL
jgi:hypothetical protein